MHRTLRVTLVPVLLALLAPAKPVRSGDAPNHLRLATTTSVDNSGLLPAILPAFEEATGIHVDILAVGSGKALELARRGDADCVLAHSPAAEAKFVAEGYGLGRVTIMRNWFLVVGPAQDPAAIKGLTPLAAFKKLASADTRFVSRGDDSGTHAKEKELWARAGAKPAAEHYIEAGSGMAETLTLANEKLAYTLTDNATYLKLHDHLELVPLVERGDELLNIYSAMWVNPEKAPGVRVDLAKQLVAWLASDAGQEAIGSYGVTGLHVFTPEHAVAATAK